MTLLPRLRHFQRSQDARLKDIFEASLVMLIILKINPQSRCQGQKKEHGKVKNLKSLTNQIYHGNFFKLVQLRGLKCLFFTICLGEDLVKYQPIDSEPSYVKKTNERGESIIIGETVTTTLKDPQGNVRKITTVESYPTETGEYIEGVCYAPLRFNFNAPPLFDS